MLSMNIQYACGECGTSKLVCEACVKRRIEELEDLLAKNQCHLAAAIERLSEMNEIGKEFIKRWTIDVG